jgi:hypothetical protein
MKSVYLLASIPFLVTATWIFYLALMNLVAHRDKLNWAAWLLAGPTLVVGLIFDFLLNMIVGSILFLELPQYQNKEWLFTTRVSRHKYVDPADSWREKLAFFICTTLLDPFSPTGRHCNPPS